MSVCDGTMMDKDVCPGLDGVVEYMDEGVRGLWTDLTSHIAAVYGSTPKMEYSRCSGKPGWNVKYKKAGKSVCTLYPEREGFTALVVINGALIEEVGRNRELFGQVFNGVFEKATLYMGTYWLMLPVGEQRMVEDIKLLLAIKFGAPKA